MSVVRSTMAQLIALVRLRVGDPAGPSQFFADGDIQDKLDECRLDVQYETLDPRPTLANGVITWTDYYADREFWEDDTTLVWGNYTVLTPNTSDFIIGHWVFTAGQFPPVFVRGKTYDVWRVSADLLEARAAGLALT